MPQAPKHSELRTRTLVARWAAWSLGHLTGVLVVFCLSCWVFFTDSIHLIAREALASGEFLRQAAPELLLQLGLSACIWFLGALAFESVRRLRLRGARRTIVRARGAVMTETLIVLPVFLLLTTGIIQLTINSTAGLLTTLSAFQAGRTVALWLPEADAGRNGVDQALVRDKARVAAAGVVAPVVPSDFVFTMSSCGSVRTDTLNPKINALKYTGNITSLNAGLRTTGLRQDLFLNKAFDSGLMAARGQPKLRFAYCATAVNYTVSGRTVTTRVAYRHHQAVPLVERLFGRLETVGGRLGYYSTIERAYVTTTQIRPNPQEPVF